jgi:hypothetical protein
MNTRSKLWLGSGVLYVMFVFWYTDFGGPLSDKEVDSWVTAMETKDSDIEIVTYIEAFLRNDTGRQFLMLNALDLNEAPPQVEGAQPGENADQLMARYMEHMIPELFKRASHPVFMGDAVYSAIDIVGIEGAEQWDQGALFRYRSRRSFAEIIAHPAIGGKHDFKLAALEKTIAYPIETSLYLSDLRFILALMMLAVTALLDMFMFSRKPTLKAT